MSPGMAVLSVAGVLLGVAVAVSVLFAWWRLGLGSVVKDDDDGLLEQYIALHEASTVPAVMAHVARAKAMLDESADKRARSFIEQLSRTAQ